MVFPDLVESIANEPVRFGDYLLEKRLAVGGMSEVYLARPAKGGSSARPLVIKRMLPGVLDDAASRAAFATEARLHMAIRHANVVEVFEAGEIAGEPYLAMEYVPGVDAFWLMRKAQTEGDRLPPGVAIYIAREICKALAAVHRLRDEEGRPLGIVHRDVTPSNIYLSENGDVKLGDFGIARSALRNARPTASHVLKGKYAYLAPEQVAGEAFDHRADLFSLVVVLTEMLIGRPLFAGSGQLAVLLAIRDCRLDNLHASAHLVPPGIMPILERGLAKSPNQRISSADELYAALADHERPARSELRSELAEWVRRSAEAPSATKTVLQEAQAMSNPVPRSEAPPPPSSPPNIVRTRDGRILEGLTPSRIIEMIKSAELGRHDQISLAGAAFRHIDEVESLASNLPEDADATRRFPGPGIADYADLLSQTSLLELCAWLLRMQETGALFLVGEPSELGRCELYFQEGKLFHVGSDDPRLLGEYLVRRGAIERAELDMALFAMPQHRGRLDSTLIALGLVDPEQLARTLKRQGRDQVASLFTWHEGHFGYFRGAAPDQVPFPLDVDIPQLMLAGLETAYSDEAIVEEYRDKLDWIFAPVRPPPPHAKMTTWPASVLHMLSALGTERRLGDALEELNAMRGMSTGEALRGLMVGIAGGIITDVP